MVYIYLDIVELFILATKNLLDRFPSKINFYVFNDEEYDASLNLPKSIEVKITMEHGGIEINLGKSVRKISIKDNDYFEWLAKIMFHYQL